MPAVTQRQERDAKLIEELRAIQDRHGFLPEEELRQLSRRTLTPLYRIEGLTTFFPHFRRTPGPVRVRVCTDIACHLHAPEALAAVRQAAGADADVRPSSCLGQCNRPVAAMVDGRVVTGLGSACVWPFVRGDTAPIAPAAPGLYRVDPYGAGEAPYAAYRRLFGDRTSPAAEQVIAMLQASGLRGMGGAGFPAGAKWEVVRATAADEKFVVCNADECEPGTFKDRFLLETFPDLLVEALAIAAACVGARRAWVFIRHEYTQAHECLAAAMQRFRDQGFGGAAELDIFESPGGYICGEETALLEAMEGRRAEPRNKPPFPGMRGLWGKPTLINNVETLCWVPAILARGAEWFAAQGVNGARGLKFIALSGHVERPGVYEVPLGIRAGDLIRDCGGGVSGGRALKAFAPGGPSSGFLPATMADVPLDFQALQQAGSMLGSGAVVALAEGTCMLEAAINFLRFFRNESCGKCVPCRVGTEKMVEMAERLAAGSSRDSDADALGDLTTAMELTSICGLGQAAPAPLRSVLEYFGPELEAHRSGHCPFGAAHV